MHTLGITYYITSFVYDKKRYDNDRYKMRILCNLILPSVIIVLRLFWYTIDTDHYQYYMN